MKKLILLLLAPLSLWAGHACSAMAPGVNYGSGRWGTFKPFAPSAIYTNISGAPADASSATWVTALGYSLQPQVGPYQWLLWGEASYYGYTWYVVDGAQMRRQNVYIDSPIDPNPAQADPGVIASPLPVPFRPRVQASMKNTSLGGATQAFASFAYPPRIVDNEPGDDHILFLDKSNCLSYELYGCYYYGGNLHCGNVSVFDMLAGDRQRPWGYTSTSVSGAPQVGLLSSATEFASGNSAGHALACAAAFNGSAIGRKAATGIASHHQYGGTNDPNLPPFGAILRLKSSFDTSPYTGVGKGILETLKSHGCVLTDGGTSVSFYLEVADTWGSSMLSYAVSPIAVNSTNFDFVAVDRNTIYSDSAGATPPTTSAPVISRFTAAPSGTVTAGAAVTLSWTVSGATAIRYLYPEIGPLRGPAEPGMTASGYDLTGVVVHPVQTTTYTLMVQNGGIHDDGAGWFAPNRVTATVCVPVSGSTGCP